MDGPGSPAPDANRLHVDDASYSPSRSPPLLQSVSGNDSSSGSPGGSRRHGSTSEKDRKNREERLKLMRERQEQEHEKRLTELKAAYEKEQRIRQLKDAERLRRIQEIKMREAQRRQAVEERRRRLESEDKEKREQILAKYKEYEHRLHSQRDQKKPVYAFGSSTPRTLAYLEHLDNSMRVYNSRLASATGAEEEKGGASSAEKRATSACSLSRKPLTASSSPNLSPQHQQLHRTRLTSGVHHTHQPPPRTTKNVLTPSGRWGGSMVASMYGGSASAATGHAHVDRDPLANVNSMTTSFAVGETPALSHVKNVRTKGTLSTVASARSQSTPRLARTTTTPRKARQDVNETSKTTGTVSKQRNGSDGHGDGAPSAAGHNQKAKGVSSARTPSAPPPAVRRPVTDSASKPVAAPAASKPPVTKEKAKPSPAMKATPPKPHHEDNGPVKIIRKPKPTSEGSTPERAATSSPTVVIDTHHEAEPAVRSPSGSIPEGVLVEQPVSIPSPHEEISVSSMHLEEDHLREHEVTDAVPRDAPAPDTHHKEVVHQHDESSPEEDMSPNAEIGQTITPFKTPDVMNMSTTEMVSNVPKSSGQGKVLSQEEATAALAERRRLAREQMEREKELERQREEQRRREEEEARRREEEEFRRQEEEELRLLEEARRLEQERIHKLIEEEEKRREEENKLKEEEERKKAEAEARAREEAERAEKERKEAEEKFKKDELERSERKKRLEAIMQRTRQSGGVAAGATSTPIGKQQQQGGSGQLFVNGGEHGEGIFSTPDSMTASYTPANTNQTSPPHHSASASVLKKLANVRPEVGRSLENILNRVKSTPNVSDADHPTTNEAASVTSVMTSSFSADKVSQGPTNGDARLTQSFYATPGAHFDTSFNYSATEGGTERTEYDVDGSAIKSQSHYAQILFNQGAPNAETNVATAALASIPAGVDSNANQSRSNIMNSLDISGEGSFFDHNDNVNGGAAAAPNGHGHSGERASASDSDASSAVTVIHQKVVSPHEISFDEAFVSPKRTASTFDDLINDNLSSTLSTPDGQSAKVVQSTASHQERPLMDF